MDALAPWRFGGSSAAEMPLPCYKGHLHQAQMNGVEHVGTAMGTWGFFWPYQFRHITTGNSSEYTDFNLYLYIYPVPDDVSVFFASNLGSLQSQAAWVKVDSLQGVVEDTRLSTDMASVLQWWLCWPWTQGIFHQVIFRKKQIIQSTN